MITNDNVRQFAAGLAVRMRTAQPDEKSLLFKQVCQWCNENPEDFRYVYDYIFEARDEWSIDANIMVAAIKTVFVGEITSAPISESAEQFNDKLNGN